MSNERILIVEDEIDLAKIEEKYLTKEGFGVSTVNDGKKALEVFKSFKPDLVILDIMLPGLDGMEVCRIIRGESKVPVIMLSAKDGDLDKVLSLGLGADDYITKPFSPLELVARVKAHIRRYQDFNMAAQKLIKIKSLEINTSSYNVSVKGEALSLTSKEFEILTLLCRNPNQVMSKEQIYEKVWGFNEYGEISAVAVYINRLREKMNKFQIDYIKTVRGVGYKLEA